MSNSRRTVVADGPLAKTATDLIGDQVTWLDWSVTTAGEHPDVAAIYTYGHPTVDGKLLDRFPNLRLISNYGVGVDHIDVRAAHDRGIVVGNTPGILDGATADMAFTLLMATGRRLIEGDRYARGPNFTTYDPGYMLGREIHGQTIGIIGMGRIGEQIAKRASGFDMRIVYHNRSRREDAEQRTSATYVSFDELLATADYVVVATPLTADTVNMIDTAEFAKMKPTACLINIARGAIVNTDALTLALQTKSIYAAGIDVTEPEPLARDHPLLKVDNLTIAPHLGSATEQTRQKMAELSVENLMRGLRGEELLHVVR